MIFIFKKRFIFSEIIHEKSIKNTKTSYFTKWNRWNIIFFSDIILCNNYRFTCGFFQIFTKVIIFFYYIFIHIFSFVTFLEFFIVLVFFFYFFPEEILYWTHDHVFNVTFFILGCEISEIKYEIKQRKWQRIYCIY